MEVRGELRLSRVVGVAVADGLHHSARSSVSTLITFPLSARQTERADFPHTSLVRDHAFAQGKLRFRSLMRTKP